MNNKESFVILYSYENVCKYILIYIFNNLNLNKGEHLIFEKNKYYDYDEKDVDNINIILSPLNGIYNIDNFIISISDFHMNDKEVAINCGKKDFIKIKEIKIFGDSILDIKSFISNCYKIISKELKHENMNNKNKLIIKNYYCWGWGNYSFVPKRLEDTIFLKKNQMNDIKKVISNFISEDTRNEYILYGIPYKLNILLHGSPGVGKTSLIRSLASIYNAQICTLNINSEIKESDLLNAFKDLYNIETITFLVIEDIDCIFTDRKKNDAMKNNITMQGILNCMDGFNSVEGVILFITTNHPNNLDSALLRPGRIDMNIELTCLDRYQAYNMYFSFMKNDLYFNEVWDYIKDKQVQPCVFQEFLFKNKTSKNITENMEDLMNIINNTDKNFMYS